MDFKNTTLIEIKKRFFSYVKKMEVMIRDLAYGGYCC